MIHRKTVDQLWAELLTRLCIATPDVFFVEIGANDGISFDPLHTYITRHRWRGLLVEPLADLFHQLRQTYQTDQGLIFENIAIGDAPGYRHMYRVSCDGLSNGTLPKWAKGIASFYDNRNALGGYRVCPSAFEQIRPHITTESVWCDTLDNVLFKHKVTKIDIMQIDVEGYDYHVLKQLDFGRFHPRIIRMEWFNLPDDEKRLALDLLGRHAYRTRLSSTDLLAWRDLGAMSHLMRRARYRLLSHGMVAHMDYASGIAQQARDSSPSVRPRGPTP